MHVYLQLICCRLRLPVLATVDSDNVLRGVQELFAVVRPGQRAGFRIGIKFCPEAQALPLFNISLDWTGVS